MGRKKRLEHLKFAFSLFRWLRRRLIVSACIGIAYYACFSVLTSLVLADESTLHFNRELL